MIIELRPFNLACIADEASFEEAITKYTDTYIETTTGWLCHRRLDANRFIRTACKGPVSSGNSTGKYKPESKFFPAGKIPYLLLEQIVQFYRDVIKKIGSNASLEARADIVWSAEGGYRVAIPTQTVSGAHLSYNNDHLRPGEVVIVDTHSHGSSMGAFFSGTDDGDDRNMIRYSGVIGKITSTTFESIWRFSNGPGFDKIAAKIPDIFEQSTVTVTYPEEWLSKVERPVSSPVIYGSNFGHNRVGGTTVHYGKGGFGGIGAQRPAGAFSPDLPNARNQKHVSAADWYRNLEGTSSKEISVEDLAKMSDFEIMQQCGLVTVEFDEPVGGPALSKKPLDEPAESLGCMGSLGTLEALDVDLSDDRDEKRELELYNSICDQVNDLQDDQTLLKVIREACDCLSSAGRAKLELTGL